MSTLKENNFEASLELLDDDHHYLELPNKMPNSIPLVEEASIRVTSTNEDYCEGPLDNFSDMSTLANYYF